MQQLTNHRAGGTRAATESATGLFINIGDNDALGSSPPGQLLRSTPKGGTPRSPSPVRNSLINHFEAGSMSSSHEWNSPWGVGVAGGCLSGLQLSIQWTSACGGPMWVTFYTDTHTATHRHAETSLINF